MDYLKWTLLLLMTKTHSSHNIFVSYELIATQLLKNRYLLKWSLEDLALYFSVSPWLNNDKEFKSQALFHLQILKLLGGFIKAEYNPQASQQKKTIALGGSINYKNFRLFISYSSHKAINIQALKIIDKHIGVQYQYQQQHQENKQPEQFTTENFFLHHSCFNHIQTTETSHRSFSESSLDNPPKHAITPVIISPQYTLETSPTEVFKEFKKNIEPIEILFQTNPNKYDIGSKLTNQQLEQTKPIVELIIAINIANAYYSDTPYKGQKKTEQDVIEALKTYLPHSTSEPNYPEIFNLIFQSHHNQNSQELINIWKKNNIISFDGTLLKDFTNETRAEVVNLLSQNLKNCTRQLTKEGVSQHIKSLEGKKPQAKQSPRTQQKKPTSDAPKINTKNTENNQLNNLERIEQMFQDKNTIFLLADTWLKKIAAGASVSQHVNTLRDIDYTINYIYHYSQKAKYKGKNTTQQEAEETLQHTQNTIKTLTTKNEQKKELTQILEKLINNSVNSNDDKLMAKFKEREDFKNMTISGKFSKLSEETKAQIIATLVTILERCLNNIQSIQIEQKK